MTNNLSFINIGSTIFTLIITVRDVAKQLICEYTIKDAIYTTVRQKVQL